MLGFTFGVVLIFIVVIGLLILYWRRVVDDSLTAHFRAAETISAGYVPKQWAKQIERRLRFRHWQRFFLPARKRTGTALALEKLDKLIRFFASSTFFEDAETRTLLLDQLSATRRRWEQMSWEQLSKIAPP